MKAPGRHAWKRGTRLRRGAATQVMVYPRIRTKSVLVSTSRELGVSLSALLIGSALSMAAKLAGCAIKDLVPEDELRQYMRGRGSDRIAVELWGSTPPNPSSSHTTDVQTGGAMTKRTDSIVELQDRAKKLEALASLLQDPQLDEVVSKLFGETQMINTSDASVYRNVQWQPGGLMEAICAIAHEFRDPFTASEVVRRLKERQFVFRRPALDATRDALYRLTHGKNAKMRVVEMGRAGKPNRYALAS